MDQVKSLCPVCLEVVDADIVEEGNKVLLRKTCSSHGFFEDEYWGDAGHYRRIMKYMKSEYGANPDCPGDCFCSSHLSNTLLGVVDVTQKCNLSCPVCFASESKDTREPTGEEVYSMLAKLREQTPKVYAVQFSGGEPTLREELSEFISYARDLGFKHIQVNTNGVRLANEDGYARELKRAGVKAAYLQFDGMDDRVYEKLRGRPLLKEKLVAVENCRRGGLDNVVLVVTLAKGVNEDQMGSVIDYAVENRDIVRCVNVQPISFVGRYPGRERITSYDFIRLVEEQTDGRIKRDYFYPIPAIAPVTEFAGALFKKEFPSFSPHPCCGLATYVVADEKGYKAINEVIDVAGFLGAMKEGARILQKNSSIVNKVWAWTPLLKNILPKMTNPVIRNLLLRVLREGSWSALRQFHYNTVLVSCMHFMDAWNFDVDRARRCIVHYSRPDGSIVPFCSFNVVHR